MGASSGSGAGGGCASSGGAVVVMLGWVVGTALSERVDGSRGAGDGQAGHGGRWRCGWNQSGPESRGDGELLGGAMVQASASGQGVHGHGISARAGHAREIAGQPAAPAFKRPPELLTKLAYIFVQHTTAKESLKALLLPIINEGIELGRPMLLPLGSTPDDERITSLLWSARFHRTRTNYESLLSLKVTPCHNNKLLTYLVAR